MKLSIIIVNYNVQFFLENCLNSVQNALNGIDAEIIVVDNNSVDGSVEMLAEKFPEVKCIANKENLGFSKANNQAIKIARGELILLLNPDTVVEENTFESCINFFDKLSDAGGLGIKMLDGKGNFLPESKRGLPTPSVAFYKIFGLSNLFPNSKRFSQYHLGHLSKDENHEIEILSGAFMMIRSEVLKKIGLLDEHFFMYGEDIDLSYRITQAGYKNYYLAESSIIHYKGESTKKSSINYVFVFYRAMAIFAKKHFSHKNAQLFSTLINLAIYLRAFVAVLTRFFKHFILPAFDAIVLYLGIFLFKNYYELEVKGDGANYYPEEVGLFGIPFIVLIYSISLGFAGGYSIPTKFNRILNGVFTGSILVLMTYSLLDESYRFSRAIVLFSVLWALFIIPALRSIFNALGIRKFQKKTSQRIAVVGKKQELIRINQFLKDTLIHPELITYVNSSNQDDGYHYAGKINHLKDIIDIYKINEVIFCAKDISSAQIIANMAAIDNDNVDFKIAPPESLYIIGSNSIESSGEYYLIGANAILKPINQRNKKIIDIMISIILLILFPIFWPINGFKPNYFSQLFKVLFGYKSFVGFIHSPKMEYQNLKIKKGLFTPLDRYGDPVTKEALQIEKLNFDYGKDYHVWNDIEIILKNLHKIANT